MSTSLIKNATKTIAKHGPSILSGLAVVGVIATGVQAARGTIKSQVILADMRDELGLKPGEKLTPKEMLMELELWKVYAPAIITGVLTIAAIVSSRRISSVRYAALASIYSATETAFKAYKHKVVEEIGKKKERKIRSEMAQDRLTEVEKRNVSSIITNRGDLLCLDGWTGRTFKSDIGKIEKRINELNRRLIDEMFISLNDLYYEIGLKGVDGGEQHGWHLDSGLIEIEFDGALTEEQEPCIVLTFKTQPRYL